METPATPTPSPSLSGRWMVASAAIMLAIIACQVNQRLIRFREDDGGGLIHKGCGQTSNRKLNACIQKYASSW